MFFFMRIAKRIISFCQLTQHDFIKVPDPEPFEYLIFRNGKLWQRKVKRVQIHTTCTPIARLDILIGSAT